MTNSIAPDDARNTEKAGSGFFSRLYSGSGGFNIIGRSKTWFIITAVIMLVALGAMLFRGFNLGIDFEGGTRMTIPAAEISEEAAEEVFVGATDVEPDQVQIVGAGDARILEITSESLNDTQIAEARLALNDAFEPVDELGQPSADAIGDSTVSESWGSSITEQMLKAAAVFLVVVFIYIMFRFSRDMAIAAVGTLFIDGIVIMGIYSLLGLQVSPATIIGLLTVLSFSLYDTVVVFDKVEENTSGFEHSTRRTYAEQVNLAVNQTIMRSINTTVSTLLPIFALLVIAVWALGVGNLADLAIIQFIGAIQGTISSIFLAAPVLVWIKRLQKKYTDHDREVEHARTGKSEEPEDLDREPEKATEPAPAERYDGPLTWRPGSN